MRNGSVGIIIIGLLLLEGCATPYQKESLFNLMRGGYSDTELTPGVYEIKVTGNPYDDRDHLVDIWRKRASELCGSTLFDESFDEGTKSESTMIQDGNIFVPVHNEYPVIEGKAVCGKES